MVAEQDQRISETIDRVRGRLLSFIRRRVPDAADAEDILHDVFYELIEADRAMKPIDRVGAWLFQVARNRIIDFFRKKRPEPLPQPLAEDDQDPLSLEDLLRSRDRGPEAAYVRSVLLDELDAALDELPEEQRKVFVAHEWEGRSFKELAAETGASVNTLLSRKRAAVLHLRRRLLSIYQELERL